MGEGWRLLSVFGYSNPCCIQSHPGHYPLNLLTIAHRQPQTRGYSNCDPYGVTHSHSGSSGIVAYGPVLLSALCCSRHRTQTSPTPGLMSLLMLAADGSFGNWLYTTAPYQLTGHNINSKRGPVSVDKPVFCSSLMERWRMGFLPVATKVWWFLSEIGEEKEFTGCQHGLNCWFPLDQAGCTIWDCASDASGLLLSGWGKLTQTNSSTVDPHCKQ